jgi:hypothetical protein
VDFGQAGKRAVRFSYASSEESIGGAARRSVGRFGPWPFPVARSLLGRWWACMAAGAM